MVACPQPHTAAHQQILGDRQGEGGQVEHLHPGRDRSWRAGQIPAAARAARRLDRLPLVGGGHRSQAAAAMPRLPTLLAPGPAPARLSRGWLPLG